MTTSLTPSVSAAPPASEPHAAHLANAMQSVSLNKSATKPTMDGPSPLERARLQYAPRLTPLLADPRSVSFVEGDPTTSAFDADAIARLFPNLFAQPVLTLRSAPTSDTTNKTIGVVLSGGPAPGGHNVIAGMYDFITQLAPDNKLIAFRDGPDGILHRNYTVVDADAVAPYRNQGGFHMIGSGRTKIETPEQFAAARATAEHLDLDALVIVGGDDSNSNAMKLAEDFRAHGLKCCVNGAPKTIDNDLRNAQVEVSFGFDTASKAYAQSVGSLAFDAVSARKAYHFVRVMGRAASHIALECALQTRPNICFIGEEVQKRGMTLTNIVSQIVDLVVQRAAEGKNYGIVILPEGLVEFMPDVEALIDQLNDILAGATPPPTREQVISKLTKESAALMEQLPERFEKQLMLERDPHGNVQVAKIEAERLLIEMVADRLATMKKEGTYTGKFGGVPHYLGYEARCSLPSNFDANYTYGLGRVAAALCCNKRTGYIATLSNLTEKPEHWIPAGFPLTMMMNIERRKGKECAVIKKMLVDLEGAPFAAFAESRDSWRLSDNFRNPGPAQFWGPVSDDVNISLALESARKAM